MLLWFAFLELAGFDAASVSVQAFSIEKRRGGIVNSNRSKAKAVTKTVGTNKTNRASESRSERATTTVESVKRALTILDELGATTKRFGLTFSELKERTRIPNGSLHYLLRTLIDSRYVRYHQRTKLHTLGVPLMTLGGQVLRSMELREEESLRLLQNIVMDTKLGAHLAILDRDYAVYVQRVEAPGFFVAKIRPGKRQIPHITAVGKALICCFEKNRVREIMEKHAISKEDFPRAKDLDDLCEELAGVRDRKRGFAIDDQEHAENVRCVAAPIYDEKDQAIFAIGVTGNTAELSRGRAESIGEDVLQTPRADPSKKICSLKKFRSPIYIEQLVE